MRKYGGSWKSFIGKPVTINPTYYTYLTSFRLETLSKGGLPSNFYSCLNLRNMRKGSILILLLLAFSFPQSSLSVSLVQCQMVLMRKARIWLLGEDQGCRALAWKSQSKRERDILTLLAGILSINILLAYLSTDSNFPIAPFEDEVGLDYRASEVVRRPAIILQECYLINNSHWDNGFGKWIYGFYVSISGREHYI